MKTKAISGVRKGAWTHEEDNLLRKCIERYGEGKWHQVPVKAGLNRCRKSCRLRWLNYLKPDIKRGEFALDEVDLLIRLHKLLGNRWSLIAGRIPGRTANDVKNYWNTHHQKKIITKSPEKAKPDDHVNRDDMLTKTTIFKPRARTFSTNLLQHCSIGQIVPMSSSIHSSQNNCGGGGGDIPTPQLAAADDGSQWWDDLFGDQEKEIEQFHLLNTKEKEIGQFHLLNTNEKEIGSSTDKEEEPIATTFWADQLLIAQKSGENFVQESPKDFSIDMDIWNL